MYLEFKKNYTAYLFTLYNINICAESYIKII